jgi:zinc/manganese transport system ATP-binding protein
MMNFLKSPWHRPFSVATVRAPDEIAASAGGPKPPHSLQPGERAYSTLDFPETMGVDLKDVSVAYGARLAVTGITGRFAPASLTAVVGPNGAGKSSLLKAIAGILPLRSGTIRSTAGNKCDVAYLPQQVDIERTFPISVGELVALGAWRIFGAFRRPPDAVFDRVAEAAASAGLEGLLDRPVESLSVGEFQRALFGRLLLQDAPVILLDEPFAALDDHTTEDLLRVVLHWHQAGRTVIAVLHDLDQVRAHFPTALLLARSCIGWGDTASVVTEENLVRARNTVRGRTKGPVLA